MPLIDFEEVLPYRAADLYDLVMDVEAYPQIFPEVKKIEIVKTAEDYRNVNVTAQVPLLTLEYNCDVKGEKPVKVTVTATEDALENMKVEWNFATLPDGQTKVSYKMSFDFGGWGLKNRIAEGYIRQNMEETRERLKNYIAQHLTRAPVAVAGGSGPVPAP